MYPVNAVLVHKNSLGYADPHFGRPAPSDPICNTGFFAKPKPPKPLSIVADISMNDIQRAAIENDPYLKSLAQRLGSYKPTHCHNTQSCGKVRKQVQAGRGRSFREVFECINVRRVDPHAKAAYERDLASFKTALAQKVENITQTVPYKGHNIKPKVHDLKIRYHVSFNISGKAGDYPSLKEAKAAVDNEVALGPGGVEAKEEFENLAKKVGEQKAAKDIVEKQERDAATVEAAKRMDAAKKDAAEKPKLGTGTKIAIGAGALIVLGSLGYFVTR